MQTYIRPKASGKELLLVTRITVFVFGMFTGVLSIILFVVRNPIYANAVPRVLCHFGSSSVAPCLCAGGACVPAGC